MKKSIKYLFIIIVMVLLSVVVTACEREQFTIIFESNGGSNIEPILVLYDEPIEAPENPTKEGHSFNGWFVDSDLTTLYDFNYLVRESFTLYAKWSINSYNFTYNTNGGTLLDRNGQALTTIKVEYQGSVAAPVNEPVKDGYDFEGWYADSAYTTPFDFETFKMPANNASVYAKWTVSTSRVTCTVDDVIFKEVDIEVGKAVGEITEVPFKVGHTFAGWYYTNENGEEDELTSSYVVNNPVTTYAKWIVNKYTVSFEENGGSEVTDIVADYDSIITRPTTPIKVGHKFEGWYKDPQFNEAYSFENAKMPANNFTLYAKWSVNKYTITFEENGGTNVDNITALYNSAVSAPGSPTKNGYTFDGWYIDEALTTAYTFTTMPLDGLKLYAKWTVNKYTIGFEENGGSEVANIIADYQTPVTKPENPTKEGHTFAGWYSDEALTQSYTFTTMPIEGITLYAKWTVNQYTITFITNEGSEVANITDDYGSEITKPANPTRLGYTFGGWYENSDFSGSAYEFSTMPLDGITLYANWIINKYTITFVENDGTDVDDITQDYNSVVTKPTDPTRTGYTFAGWYIDEKGTQPYTFSTMPLNGITLYAKWTINTYEIKFETNGGSEVISITANYLTSIHAPVEPTKEGYTFNGWYENEELTGKPYEFSVMPLNGATLYAKWTINSYTLTIKFKNDVTDDVVETVVYNSSLSQYKPENPTKPGTQFKGWVTANGVFEFENAIMPAADLVVEAVYEDEITVNFGGYATLIGLKGETLTIPADPTKDGYTFDGWYLDESFETEFDLTVFPENDITVYVKWNVNSYTIIFEENGGSEVTNITGDYLSKLTKPADPTRTGYTFAGWYRNAELTQAYSFDNATMPLNGLKLYAKWNINSYTITFVTNMDGITVSSMTAQYGAIISAPVNPQKEGYTFNGWYENSNLTGSAYEFSTMPLDGKTLYASWTVNKYTITFVENDGTDVDDITQDYNSVVTKPTDPTRTGYTFAGWYIDEKGTQPYTFSTMPLNGITLYAKWTINTYEIKFVTNADTVTVATISAYYLQSITKPEDPTRTGYSFKGWYDNEELTGAQYVFDVMPLDGITLYAKWEPNTYLIKFDIKGANGSVSDINAIYDVEYMLTASDIYKTGYELAGWSLSSSATEVDYTLDAAHSNLATSGEITIYAVWVKCVYEIKFAVEGVTDPYILNIEHQFDNEKLSDVDNIPSSTKFGYTLVWYKDGEEVNLSNIQVTSAFTLTGKYVANYYDVQFISDNKVIYTQTMLYGADFSFNDYVKKLNDDFVLLSNLKLYLLGVISTQGKDSAYINALNQFIVANQGDILNVNSLVKTSLEAFMIGGLSVDGLYSIIEAQVSDMEKLIIGYENNKVSTEISVDGKTEMKVDYAPFKSGYLFKGWLLGDGTKYIDIDGNEYTTGSKYTNKVPGSTSSSNVVRIIAKFEKLASIQSFEVYNPDEHDSPNATKIIDWDDVDTSFIPSEYTYNLYYKVYYLNGGNVTLLSSVTESRYEFTEYGTYNVALYAHIDIYNKDILVNSLVSEVPTVIPVQIDMEGLGDTFDETKNGDYYRRGTVDDQDAFIFYTENRLTFALDGINLVATDAKGNPLSTTVATLSGNVLQTNTTTGSFYFTNGVDKNDEGNLKVYYAVVVPYVTQFELDKNLSNFKENQTTQSPYLNASNAIYSIGRYNENDVADSNKNKETNLNIYNNVLTYKNNGFKFGLNVATLGGIGVNYISYGDYITYTFYNVDENNNFTTTIDSVNMGTYDRSSGSWSFTAPAGKYGVRLSITTAYLAPKQVNDQLFSSIDLVFELDDTINVYTHEQFKQVYENFTLGSNNVDSSTGYINRGISLHSDITPVLTENQFYYQGNSNTAMRYYLNQYNYVNPENGTIYDGSPINIHPQYIFNYLSNTFESGNPYLRVTTEEISENYSINGNYFTINGKDLPHVTVNSIGNLSSVNGYYIANTQNAIITYLVGGDGIDVVKNDKPGSTAHLIVNDIHVVGNTSKPTFDSSSADSSIDVMNRNSGGYCGIQTAMGASLSINNSIISNTVLGVRNNYGVMGNGKHTGSMTTIDYTTITSCWANCVYGQYAGNFVFTNSLLKDSGGAAIHIEDGTSKADQPCGSYVLIDENTIVENFVSGTEGYFKAYSMEIIAMMLKGSIDGSVAGITSMDPRIPSYTLIREITDPVTGLPTEKMNFVILFKTCGENDKATAVQNGYAYQNRINLYLPYYSFTNAAVGNIVPSDTLGNYYNTSYLYAAEDKSNSYAQSTGLMMKTNYNGIDGSQGMFLFENHQTGPSWLIGLGLDPVSTQ